MAGKFTLEGKNGDIARKMLKDITTLLEKHNIDYWLEGGTLLGIIREDRLLPWDNDLDLSVTERHYSNVLNIVHDVKKAGYRIKFKVFKEDNPPFKNNQVRLIKIKNRRFFFFSGQVSLDIFIKFEQNGQYFWQVGKKKKSVPSYFYKELVLFGFDNKSYTVPKLYEDYLTFRYGDWKTPIKEWNTFTDDKAIKGDM